MSSASPVDVLCSVIKRRGWAQADAIENVRQTLPADSNPNSLLAALLDDKLIVRSQAKELRLDDDDLSSIDHYELLGKLGSGAMGSVYLDGVKTGGLCPAGSPGKCRRNLLNILHRQFCTWSPAIFLNR